MSNTCLTLVRSLKTGNPMSKALLHLLADHADNEFQWRITLNDLCRESEMVKASVCKYLKQLEQDGFIQRIREPGKSTQAATLYRLTLMIPNKCMCPPHGHS